MVEIKNDLIFDILNAKNRVNLSFPGIGDLHDKICFGFSYVETEDHLVSHVIACPETMKNIICSIKDTILNPCECRLGTLWTSDLMVSRRLHTNQIIFANEDLSVVLDLDIQYPNNIQGGFDGDV